MILKFNPFKSMTIQGTVAAVAPYLVNSLNPDAFPPAMSGVITGLGLIWAMVGARNAVEKVAGKSVAELAEQLLRKGSTPPTMR